MIAGRDLWYRIMRPSSLPAEVALTASALLILLVDQKAWTHRRVESIKVLDDKSVHRRVSIDFAIPERLGARRVRVTPDLLPYLPLTLLEKELLRNFDLRDSRGQPVSMLTKHENGRVAGDTLVVAAETVLGRRLPRRIECRLRRVAENDPETAQRELEEWPLLGGRPSEPNRELWPSLTDDEGFMQYAQTLVDNFLLLACTDPWPGKRRLMKLGYEEPLESTDLGLPARFAVSMGWKRKTLRFDAPSANLAASFHLEIAAPQEMEIDSARLTFTASDDATSEPTPAESFDGPLIQRAHLYASDVPGDYVGTALVYLRARRQGFLRGTFAAGSS